MTPPIVMDYNLLTLPCVTSLLASVLYLNTLSAGFAYDDSRAILKNQDLLPETPIGNLFYNDFWGTLLTHSGSHKSYRPLCVLTFRLNYLLHGLDPWGYHFGNVICHALTTALFTALAQWMLGKKTYPTYSKEALTITENGQDQKWCSHIIEWLDYRNIGATAAGLLFASHPIHTEAVAGVVGRADLLACAFFLLTFIAYIRYVYTRHSSCSKIRFVYVACVALLSAAAMLSKEHAITVLAVCVVYEIMVVHRANPRDILKLAFFTKMEYRAAIEGVCVSTISCLALLGFRIYFMDNKPPVFAPSDNPASDSDSLLTRILTYNFLPAANFWMMLCPKVLSFDWSMDAIPLIERFDDLRNIGTLLFFISLAYIAFIILRTTTTHQKITNHHSYTDEGYSLYSSTKEEVYNNNVCSRGKTTPSAYNYYQHEHVSNNLKPPTYKNVYLQASTQDGISISQITQPIPPLRSIDVVILSTVFIVFPFIPASNMFFYVGFVIAERVLYMPSMGLCLLVGLGVQKLCNLSYNPGPIRRRMIVAWLFIVLVAFSGKTMLRNLDWQNEERLYESGVPVNPAKAWGNLANIYNDKGDVKKAENAYRSALIHRPNMADVHYNLGILLQNQKRHSEAVESYQKAIHYRPKLSVAHLNLAILTAQLGDYEQAKRIYTHCADLDTAGLKDPKLHEGTKISCLFNHGRLLMDEGKLEEALVKLFEAVERRPAHYSPQSLYNMLGETYLKMERLSEAENWYLEALKVKPDHLPAFLTMGKLRQLQDRYTEAEEWLDKAKKVEPNNYLVDSHKAQLLAATGRTQEAINMFDALLPHLSEDFDAIYSAAGVFREGNRKDQAEKLYIAATKIKPKEPAAWMNLGAMLHINGKYTEAEEAYLKGLELRPGDHVTTDNLKKLRSIMRKKET